MKMDVRTFKALSSMTRMSIIKNLSRRRMTQTELSSVLKMHVSTVKEHLDILEEAGLINLNEEGHKWKYYSLSDEGRNLFSPYNREIKIILPVSIGLIFVGLWDTFRELIGTGIETVAKQEMSSKATEASAIIADTAVNGAVQFPITSISFIIAGVFFLGIAIGFKLRK